MSFLASSKLLSKCERMRDAGKAGKHVMTPSCDANGMYESTQCSEKMCWCAQPNGKLIPNTFHKKMVDRAPNCRRHAGKWSVFCVQILCILWCWLVFLSPFFCRSKRCLGRFAQEYVHDAPVCVFEPPLARDKSVC